MMRFLALAAVLAAAGCSKREALNYRHCLKLRVGMTREEMLRLMGAPDETSPYVEGKTLPYLKGRTGYEWSTPASMPAPNDVSIDEATGKIESIRCGESTVTAAVFVEPPAPVASTATFAAAVPSSPAATSTAAPAAVAPRAGPRERSSSNSSSSGRPLTE